MPQKPGLVRLSLIGTILLGLLISGYLLMCIRFWKRKPSDPIIQHSVDTHPDDALKYWTEDKMRNAKATNMPHVTNLEPGKQDQQRPPHGTGPEHS